MPVKMGGAEAVWGSPRALGSQGTDFQEVTLGLSCDSVSCLLWGSVCGALGFLFSTEVHMGSLVLWPGPFDLLCRSPSELIWSP